MASKDLKIQIEADAAKAERAFQRLQREVRKAEDSVNSAYGAAEQLDRQLEDELAESAAKAAEAQEKLGRGLVAFGTATLAGLGMATKAAMDWETAWAGVLKTVDGSDEELASLESELRELTETLPATHQEIAGVAEAAGQLGIATGDVAAFTEVMINLGETTNLTAEEAAMAIAQLMNVMGTAPDDVGRLGAALVDLGNNSATTERDILMLAQRLAAAGAQVGMSESDVLAFASAMASLGIRAEAGGTAVSRVMSDMAKAVAQGGDELSAFAEVAGVSADEFAAAFEEDPAQAIATFIGGLQRIEQSGGDVFTVLDDLGFGGLRVRDTLLRLAGGGDILNQSLERGAQAWEDNTALAEEAQQRYETTEAKVALAKNALVDLAIDVGDVILPAVAGLAEGAADLLGWFADLPGPVKTAGTVLAGLVGTTALATGGFLLLAPRISESLDILRRLGPTGSRAAGAMSRLGRAVGFAGPVLALSAALMQLHYASENAAPSVDGATQSLLDLAEGKVDETVQELVGLKNEVKEINDQNYLGFMADSLFGLQDPMEKTQVIEDYKGSLESFDQALVSMVKSGAADQARESVIALQEALGYEDSSLDDVIEILFPAYGEALKGADAEQRMTEDGAYGVAEGIDAAGAAAEQADPFLVDLGERFGATGAEAEAAGQGLIDGWASGFEGFVDIVGLYGEELAKKEEAEREAAQATADATGDASDSWEDYYSDVNLTLEEYLAALERQVEEQAAWADNMAILAARGVDEGLLDNLARMGPESAPLVQEMVDGTDAQLEELNRLTGEAGNESATNWATEFSSIGPLWEEIARTQGRDTVNELVGQLQRGEITWSEILHRYGNLLDEEVPPSQGTDLWVEDEIAREHLSYYGEHSREETADQTTRVDADTSPATRVINKYVSDQRQREIALKIKAKIETFLGGIFGGGGGGGGGGGAVTGGWRTPMNRGTYRVGGGIGSYPGHTGQDLPAATGTPVYAAKAGRVTRAMTMSGSYGNHVYLSHGGWQTRYAHLSSRTVSPGQYVAQGAMIGRVGSTGNSTGPHLHFEVRRGGRVLNPRNYMRFAQGGPVDGPGGPMDDQIPMLGSNGEYMMRAAARAHYGDALMHKINNMELPKLAGGGPVGASAPVGHEHYGGDTYNVYAPTTAPTDLISAAERARNRRDAVHGRVVV